MMQQSNSIHQKIIVKHDQAQTHKKMKEATSKYKCFENIIIETMEETMFLKDKHMIKIILKVVTLNLVIMKM